MTQHIAFILQHYLWLVPLGFCAGAYGTLIGAGGGFVLVPALLLLYPGDSPETITSISLAVVFFNALSGSFAYARKKRIDYRSGLIFSIATVPGAILGAFSTSYVPRARFDALFGIFMILVAGFLMYYSRKGAPAANSLEQGADTGRTASQRPPNNLIFGLTLSTSLGYLSSFLGIGAGFIYVPAFVYLLNFPIHIATATSQFILVFMALTGSTTHILGGLFHHGVRRTLALAIGVIFGAQVGAWCSQHVQGEWIIRGLAAGLGLVGMRLLVMAWR
jgi:uncharacterized protein